MSTPTLLVTGTLQEVSEKLNIIQGIFNERKVIGYPPFHSSENWRYVTQKDERVCPICEPHDEEILTGQQVKEQFPQAEFLGGLHARPRTHLTQRAQNLRIVGECRCNMWLLNASEAFEVQLHAEKEASI